VRRLAVEERRAQLVEKGMELFAKHAFDAISTERLAKEAGVSKALLFHYFGSKHGYYVATIQRVAQLVAELTEPDPTLPLDRAVRTSLTAYVGFVREHGDLYIGMVRGGVGVDAEAHGILDAVRAVSVERVLTAGEISRPSARLRAALLGWVAFTETTTLAWFERRGFSERALVDLLLDTLFSVLEREGRKIR
jgi:AcrR family transcriptional regulator